MEGFYIETEQERLSVSLAEGVIGITIDSIDGDARILVEGEDHELITCNWLDRELKLGECIVLTYEDKITDKSRPTTTVDLLALTAQQREKIETQQQLKEYHRLRKQLVTEGVIEE